MYRLVVFREDRRARSWLRQLAQDVGSAATFMGSEKLLFKGGDIIHAVAIPSANDVVRVKGLRITEVLLKEKIPKDALDRIGAMPLSEVQD